LKIGFQQRIKGVHYIFYKYGVEEIEIYSQKKKWQKPIEKSPYLGEN